MNKIILIIGAALLTLVVTGLLWQRHAIACETVQLSGYQAIAPDVYASPGLAVPHSLLMQIEKGKERVKATFGPITASPKMVLVANTDEAASFGANSTATAHFTPLGSCMVFGPEGQNVNVIAHEWVHAEVWHRVGWLVHWREIPVWFNEGVALMVDYRPPFLIDNIELSQTDIDAVKQRNSGRAFFDGANTHQHYLAARLAVKSLAPERLYPGLARIRDGESFGQVFQHQSEHP